MSNPQNIFENENISVVLVRKPECRIQAEITVRPKMVKNASQQAIRIVGKQISVPGFRKGKAPESFVLQHYSKAVHQELKDTLLNMAFRESLQLTHEYPFGKNFYAAEVKSLDVDNGAVLFYDYEVYPNAPLINAEHLDLKTEPQPSITQKEINTYLDSLKSQKAAWQEITDRKAQENDFVDLDIVSLDENPEGGDKIAKPLFNKTRVQIAADKMDAWMRKLVIGTSKGDVVEGLSEDESDPADCKHCEAGEEHDHKHHFTPTHIRVTVHGVFEGTMPEFNDEFARQYGANDVEDLKEKVTTYLTNYMAQEQRQMKRNQLFKEIVTQYHFDVPVSNVNRYISENAKVIHEELHAKNLSEEEIAAEMSRMFEHMKSDIRLFFLFQEFANNHKIQVSQEEVTNEWSRQAFMRSGGQMKHLSPEDTEKAMNQIRQQLLREKVLDFIIDQKQTKEATAHKIEQRR